MGKRELLIIIIFAAVIGLAYQLTAPPAKEGEGFSLSRFLRSAKREMQGNQPIVQHTATGVIPVKKEVTDLRVASVPRGVQVIGESREDIAYELVIESSGPDQPAALEFAKKTSLKTDDLGTSLAL